MPQVVLQQGVNGYTGPLDTMFSQARANQNYGSASELSMDAADQSEGGQQSQGLLQFTGLIGTGSGQIPRGAHITKAELTVQTTSKGDGAALHRMLSSWDENSTWTSLSNGIQADGTEAAATADLVTGQTAVGTSSFDVTTSVQAWADGAKNEGWAFLPLGDDGWDFSSSESQTAPKLTVTYTLDGDTPSNPPPVSTPFSGSVAPTVETATMPGTYDYGDVADDPAIWVNTTDPARSLVIGTNKDPSRGGLYVFDLQGRILDSTTAGQEYNNVDLRYGFSLGDRTVDVVGATNRETNNIDFFTVNPATRELNPVGSVPTGLQAYGFALGEVEGRIYAYASTKDGTVRQFELDGSSGMVSGRAVRTFDVGSGWVEGMVVDDQTGSLYVGEEALGIWKYGADPASGSARTQVDKVGGGHLTPDVEGLSIYYGPNGSGYLIASSQGSSTYAVYDRAGSNPYLGAFRITDGSGIDGVSDTDGLDVTNLALGSAFPSGLLVVHDNSNAGASTSNFKLVPWEDVAALGGLITNISYNPLDGTLL